MPILKIEFFFNIYSLDLPYGTKRIKLREMEAFTRYYLEPIQILQQPSEKYTMFSQMLQNYQGLTLDCL
jgi:hypothetical protein